MSSAYTPLISSEVTLEKKQAGDTTPKVKDSVTDKDSADKPKLPPDDYIDFVIRMKRCVEDGENIDIYQYLAFKWKEDARDAPAHEIWRLTHEVIMCIIAQIIGVVVILEQVIEDGREIKDSCNDSPIELKLLAFALSSVAGYVSMEVFMHEKGMYTGGIADCNRIKQIVDINSNPPEWISLFWLGVGTWVNRVVSIGAVGGSFAVIYFSDNAFDMVLNSVALFFLMELDNMLMTQPKYNDMCEYLSMWPENKTREDIKGYSADKEFFWLARPAEEDILGCCDVMQTIAQVCNLCCFCCYAFFGVFFIIACIVVPVYIGVCY